MPKIRYKSEKGTLHISGGRFFDAGKEYEVTAKERDELLKEYGDDLEEVKTSKSSNENQGE
jgi:hypothetical protein